jgi:hypothetical protein
MDIDMDRPSLHPREQMSGWLYTRILQISIHFDSKGRFLIFEYNGFLSRVTRMDDIEVRVVGL